MWLILTLEIEIDICELVKYINLKWVQLKWKNESL